jgi:hypothetical protein
MVQPLSGLYLAAYVMTPVAAATLEDAGGPGCSSFSELWSTL